MGEVSDTANRWIESAMPKAMHAVGIVAAADVANSIDVAFPPASLGGEPPHKRTGNLYAGVSHSESRQGSEFQTTIASRRAEGDPDVPVYLEYGTSKMLARPYMGPAKNRAESYAPMVLKRALDGEATYATAG